MTPHAADFSLVQATLPRLTGRIGQASVAFSAHLLRYAPSMTAGLAAGRKGHADALVMAICEGLSGACQAEVAQARLASLAHSFRDAGLGPRGYIAIHAALMDMVAEHIAEVPEAEEPWAEVIGTILSSMVSEAYGPRRVAMPLAA